jgi:hypothetical protein
MNSPEKLTIEDQRNIKFMFSRLVTDFHSKWVISKDIEYLCKSKYPLLQESIKFGLKNHDKKGIYYDLEVNNLYNKCIKNLYIEFKSKLAVKYSGKNSDLYSFMETNEKFFYQKLWDKFTFDYFLVKLYENAPNIVLKYMILPKNVYNFEGNEKEFNFVTHYSDEEIEEQFDFTGNKKIPKYTGYIIPILQFLKINPWNFKRDYNNTFQDKIHKRFPNFPERNGEEIVDTKDISIVYFNGKTNYEPIPLIIFARVKPSLLIYNLTKRKKFIEFPRNSYISFFNQEDGILLFSMKSIKGVFVALNRCEIEYKETGTSFEEYMYDEFQHLPVIGFPPPDKQKQQFKHINFNKPVVKDEKFYHKKYDKKDVRKLVIKKNGKIIKEL